MVSNRSRTRIWVVATVVTLVLLCCAPAYATYEGMVGTSRREVTRAADPVHVPADFKLIEEYWLGGWPCFNGCSLYRRYSSPSSKQETYRAFSTVLQKAGYRCECEGVDTDVRRVSTQWYRGEFTYSLDIFATGDERTVGPPTSRPLDRARPVHADVQVYPTPYQPG